MERGEIAPEENFSSFLHYFVTCCHSFILKQGLDFHFEISGNSNKRVRDNEVRMYLIIQKADVYEFFKILIFNVC